MTSDEKKSLAEELLRQKHKELGRLSRKAAFMVSSEGINLNMLFTYYITGLPMDLVHAFGTVIFIMFAAEPMLENWTELRLNTVWWNNRKGYGV